MVALSKKVQDIVTQLEEAKDNYKAKQKEKTERLLKICNPNLTSQEIEELEGSPSLQAITQQFEASLQFHDQAKSSLQCILCASIISNK
jgi:t-SNARE complex subunit (syntaxin)